MSIGPSIGRLINDYVTTFQDDSGARLQHLFSHAEVGVQRVPEPVHRHGPAHRHESALLAAEGHENDSAAARRTKVSLHMDLMKLSNAIKLKPKKLTEGSFRRTRVDIVP